MKKINVKTLTYYSIVAALYVALTLGFAPLSYMNIQFRLSEILVLLAFINPGYIVPITLGTAIANLFSPLGIYDLAFGTGATLISVYLISITKNLFIATLWPVIINALVVGVELTLLFSLPLVLTMAQVAIGEFVVVSIIGYFVIKAIMRNDKLFNRLKNIQ